MGTWAVYAFIFNASFCIHNSISKTKLEWSLQIQFVESLITTFAHGHSII